MAVVKFDAKGDVVVDAISSIPFILFATEVALNKQLNLPQPARVDTTVANVVTATAVNVDWVVFVVVDNMVVANVVVAIDVVVVGLVIGGGSVVVVFNVDKIVLIVVVVRLIGASVAI